MRYPGHTISRVIRQVREAYELAKSPNFRFLKFFPPGHFYSPIPDVSEIKGRDSMEPPSSVKEISGIDLNVEKQRELLDHFSTYNQDLLWPVESSDAQYRYEFNNHYFSYGDAVTLYSMMRHLEPKKVIEVGSGYSSALMLDVNRLFFDYKINITCIEPFPERLKSLLNDEDLTQLTLLEQPVQEVDLSLFENLEAGDILFIDSSHVSKIGSDVNHLIHHVLPTLSSGVIIHFHDILWPFEYPKKWLKAGRAWNEAYIVRAFLQYNSLFEILFFNSYLERHHRSEIRKKLPLMLRQPSSKMTPGNSSLWLRKR